MNRFALVAATFAMGATLAVLSPAAAAPGNTVKIGVVGGPLPVATVTDDGTTFVFGLSAIQQNSDGNGDVVFSIGYPPNSAFKACTVHGSSGLADFTNTGSEGGQVGFDEYNNIEFDDGSLNIQCGRAYGNTVSIKGCKAHIQAHAFQHSDHPYEAYAGAVGVEIDVQKIGLWARIEIETSSPVGKFKISGWTNGPISMPSCH